MEKGCLRPSYKNLIPNQMVIYTSESKRSLNLKNKISDGGYLMDDSLS